MIRSASLLLCLALAACGGKSAAKPAEPAAQTADDPDSHGITGDSVPVQACYEDCYTDGAKGATDWASKSEADKQAACNAQCVGATPAADDGSAAK